MTLLLLLSIAVILLILDVPMVFAVGLAAIGTALISGDVPVSLLMGQIFQNSTNYLLIAIPMFILSGKLMAAGGLADDVLFVAERLLGRFRGGVESAVVVACMFFSGMTGAKVAEVAAISSAAVPSLKKRGYSPAYVTAVITAASAAGELVPPAINMIVVASVINVPVTKLFVGGLLPAILFVLLIIAVVMFWHSRNAALDGRQVRGRASAAFGARMASSDSSAALQHAGSQTLSGSTVLEIAPPPKAPAPDEHRRSFRSAAIGCLVALGLPLVIFVGLFGGIFSATEAGAVSVLYALLVACVLYRRLNARAVFRVAVSSAELSGSLIILVAAASALSQILAVENVTSAIQNLVPDPAGNAWLVLLVTILVFVVLGSLLEGLPAILIFMPVMYPLAQQAGIDPIRFAVLVVGALGVGLFLPPTGVGLVTACAVGGVSVPQVLRRYGPFIVALMIGLVILAFVPFLSTYLPGLIGT